MSQFIKTAAITVFCVFAFVAAPLSVQAGSHCDDTDNQITGFEY